MKILPQKPLSLLGRVRPLSFLADWQDRWSVAGEVAFPSLERIKTIGSSDLLEDYDKRKLGIFNLLNFFQLITGILIPVAGVISNRHLPVMAWVVAMVPSLISVLVLVLNSRRLFDLAQIAYFVLYPIATSVVYFWGINMELSFILYSILSVFFIQELSHMVFALGFSMVSYFVLAVLCRNFNWQLTNSAPLWYIYLFNQFLAIVFIFYGLFLIKKENTGYQQNILRQKEEIAANSELLQLQTDELSQLNAFKNRLFSIIAHDLKSPIYALRNLFRNMQQCDLPAEEIKEMVPEVVNELTHTTSLMENVLHWARSQMQAYTVKPQNIDLPELMTEVARLLRLQADGKHIGITLKTNISLAAHADRDMVHLILRNLLSNAIKYTPENGCIEVGARSVANGISIYVKDNGMGIPSDALLRIQESNFFSTKGTAGEAGTGLGLMLCKEFVIRNGGEMSIDSTAGKGSTFSFTLPAAME